VKPLAADRYEIRFTASAATRDKLKVAQDLLRHAIPSGEVAAIFDRALSELIEAHSRCKMAVVRRPAKERAVRAGGRAVVEGSRQVAAEVKRVVWIRDAGRSRVPRRERPSLQRARAQRLRGGRVLRNRSEQP
jgi:hypothetical protein